MNAGDIVERDPTEKPAAPPTVRPTKPLTKKWVSKRRPVVLDPGVQPQPIAAASTAQQRPTASFGNPNSNDSPEEPLTEPERIHLENIRKMQKMTPEEIEKEREEIFKSMNPEVLQSLLRRAELKESQQKQNLTINQDQRSTKAPLIEPSAPTVGSKAPPKASLADWDPSPVTPEPATITNNNHNTNGNSIEEVSEEHSHDSHVHFAPPPEDLRQYFPDLPVETEKLAWMQPIGKEEEDEYSPELVSLPPSELRFDFHGDLITPRRSQQIPVSAGLHHHGDAPTAAGYTLPELAHLSRSSHPAQRAMAIQTVGRVLHKLRRKEFARSSDLQEGLNALVQQTRIMDTLAEAADDSTRSITVRSRALEALWLANADNSPKETEKNL